MMNDLSLLFFTAVIVFAVTAKLCEYLLQLAITALHAYFLGKAVKLVKCGACKPSFDALEKKTINLLRDEEISPGDIMAELSELSDVERGRIVAKLMNDLRETKKERNELLAASEDKLAWVRKIKGEIRTIERVLNKSERSTSGESEGTM